MTRYSNDHSVHWHTPQGHLGKVIGLAALILFAFMVWMVFIDRYTQLDETVFATLSPRRNDQLTKLMRLVSYLGNTSFLIVANCVLVAFFLLHKQRWTALVVTVVGLTSVGLMTLLKRSFHRVRPDEPLIHGITNFSFPSGHAFMSVAFYGLLINWALAEIRNRTRRMITIVLLLLILFLIGFSRIYLRVHYTTDVLAGWGMGTAWLVISLTIMDRIERRYQK